MMTMTSLLSEMLHHLPPRTNAAEMYRKAADGGSAYAQFDLGGGYEFGYLGLDEDGEFAFEMYRSAADEGDQDAQCKISGACQLGK